MNERKTNEYNSDKPEDHSGGTEGRNESGGAREKNETSLTSAKEEQKNTKSKDIQGSTEGMVQISNEDLNEDQEEFQGKQEKDKISEEALDKKYDRKWYIVHVSANTEKQVYREIYARAAEEKISDMFSEVLIPSYIASEIQRGKKQEVEKKTTPGYVFVKMGLNQYTIALIKSIKKITAFLGGANPTPVPQYEIDRIIEKTSEWGTTQALRPYNIGDAVQIISGTFDSFNGNIKELNMEKKRIKVAVSVFGRENIIDLDLDMVKKI